MGLMLEQASPRLLGRGLAHWASPDKRPEARLATIALAGELRIPFTTGLLIGIGETPAERAETIALLAELAQAEHVQELIVQNFRAKPGTRMAAAPEPTMDELLRAVAVTRLACGPGPNVQAGTARATQSIAASWMAFALRWWCARDRIPRSSSPSGMST